MIKTGEQYRESLRDDREVWISGERVKDVTTHPAFKPVIDARARIYDLQHAAESQSTMTYEEDGERFAIGSRLPYVEKGLDGQTQCRRLCDERYRRCSNTYGR